MDESKGSSKHGYKIAMLPPPGAVVAPNGFPANPYPPAAPQSFKDAMNIRVAVFCDEQECSLEFELDEDDPRSWHWILYKTEEFSPSTGAGEPVSVLRIVPPPHGPHPNGFEDPNEKPYVKLGRVATVKRARGQGLNSYLVETAFRWIAENPGLIGKGWDGLVLTHSQVPVEKVYQKLGFLTDENLGRWDEEGIAHVGMWRRLETQK